MEQPDPAQQNCRWGRGRIGAAFGCALGVAYSLSGDGPNLPEESCTQEDQDELLSKLGKSHAASMSIICVCMLVIFIGNPMMRAAVAALHKDPKQQRTLVANVISTGSITSIHAFSLSIIIYFVRTLFRFFLLPLFRLFFHVSLHNRCLLSPRFYLCLQLCLST